MSSSPLPGSNVAFSLPAEIVLSGEQSLVFGGSAPKGVVSAASKIVLKDYNPMATLKVSETSGGITCEFKTYEGLTQMADERVSTVASLTDPEMIMSLSGGKTMVYFIMIAVFAIALGLVVALILESMDHRVYHPKDVEENLQLPVFASVTRTD